MTDKGKSAMERTIGILLAGGRSSRYGTEKAFADVEGTSFYEASYYVLESVCDEVIIVTRKDLMHQFPPNYQVITDIDKYVGCGPLAGIYSAMMYKEAENYIVLPCDVPLISQDIMQKLINNHKTDITVVEADGRIQSLISVWSDHTKENIAQALEKKQYRIRDVFETTSIMKVDGSSLTAHQEVFMNVNTLEQDKEMRKWLKS